MAIDLNCPECGENIGKASEYPSVVRCGNCDTKFRNVFSDDYSNNSCNQIDRNRQRRIMAQMGWRG